MQLCIVRAEKQKRVDVCVGFLNDNKNKAEEMRQVVEEALMILMLLTAGIRKTRSSWLNCVLRDDEAVYWVSIGHYESVAVGN